MTRNTTTQNRLTSKACRPRLTSKGMARPANSHSFRFIKATDRKSARQTLPIKSVVGIDNLISWDRSSILRMTAPTSIAPTYAGRVIPVDEIQRLTQAPSHMATRMATRHLSALYSRSASLPENVCASSGGA